MVKAVSKQVDPVPKLEVAVGVEGQQCLMEIDTATAWNFMSTRYWGDLGRLELEPATSRYESASNMTFQLKEPS